MKVAAETALRCWLVFGSNTEALASPLSRANAGRSDTRGDQAWLVLSNSKDTSQENIR